MVNNLFVVYDEEVGECSFLCMSNNDIVYDRQLSSFLNSPQSPFKGVESKCVVKKIGTIDTYTGVITPLPITVHHRLDDYLEVKGDINGRREENSGQKTN